MTQEREVLIMPTIMPIRDLRNTSEISELAHKKQEPIFITKNGYSDLVVMSAELYEKFAQINRIDQAIYEAEKEVENGAELISVDSAIERLNKKYYG
ncbi:prevent-host-death family protein [Coprococcus eutactus ATCC 27759]|jgi:prevent-host-death family protein|nr:prevent-host-death family protein [Coprococcus eutactus ATCC 27759]